MTETLLLEPYLDIERTDEQVAEQTLDGEGRIVLVPVTARRLRNRGQYPELLAVAERLGLKSARSWMAVRSLTWLDEPLHAEWWREARPVGGTRRRPGL